METYEKEKVYTVRIGGSIGSMLSDYAKKKGLTVASLTRVVLDEWLTKRGRVK